nr:CopL family metal-binding regulatory protein [Pseudoxanthomonas mexicana]
MLALNGAWSAYASVSMGSATAGQASQEPSVVSDEDCAAHHNPSHHADAPSIEKAKKAGHGDHAGPDCCKSSACRCACVHACASALPAHMYVSVQLALGLHVMPLPLGHAAPALPHLIRPPIG